MSNKLTIGLIGFGCVGSGLYEVLNQSKLIDARIKSIVVKDPTKKRSIPEAYFSYSRDVVLNDEEINVVVELINDSAAAYDIVKSALSAGKNVVTANKKLIAEHLPELLALARTNGVSLLYEGAVAGSIPIIRNLEEYYNNDSISSVQGIVNGTTNYILTKANQGADYETALKDAQELGFAELDPTLDVDGFDSKYKLGILLKHAFGLTVKPSQILNLGIRSIHSQDIRYAQEKGYRIKLISHAEKIGNKVIGFVAPQFIENSHFAYEVNNEFNAVIVESLFSNKQLFIGKGAGSLPTASAVLSDISALKLQYSYEYRKTDQLEHLSYTEDFYIKVYIGARFVETLDEFPFYHVDEVFCGSDHSYQTGWVHFEEVKRLQLLERHDISFVILPTEIFTSDQLDAFLHESVGAIFKNV